MSETSLVASLTARGRTTGALGVVLVAGGLAARYPLVVALGGCLLALVAAELVAVRARAGVEVTREVEPRVVVRHGPCHGTVRVRGRRRRGLVRLDVADRVDGALVPVRLPALADHDAPSTGSPDETVLTYEVPTPRRGLVEVGPLLVRRYGLTGMAATSVETGDVVAVRVLPRRVPLSAMFAGRRRSAVGGDDSVEQGGTDLTGLHEYTLGDDLRRLHWATSARSGRLMVREDADPAEPHVSVVLDDRLDAYPEPGPTGGTFEDAVELAAALCRVTAAAGHPMRFRTTSGRTEVVVPGSASRQPRREAQELEWLFAEVDAVAASTLDLHGARDLDVVVAVTGSRADLKRLSLALGGAPTRVVAVVDESPVVAASQEAGVLVLRGTTSGALADLWDASALDGRAS